jgi:hypothetical protein
VKPDITTVDMVLCFLALGFTGLWLVACICYAHCRGDAEIGVAETQGREPEAGSGEHGAERI